MAVIELDKIRKPAVEKKSQEESGFMAFLSKDISLFGKGLSDKKKEKFYSELHVLISHKLDIKTVLELVEEQQEKEADKELYGRIGKKVIGGMTLSEALEQEGIFSNYEVFSLRIGETSGMISEVLADLKNYFSKKIKQKRQMVQAFSYPAVVMCISLGVMSIMLRVVVPMFQSVFKRFGGELPYITKVVLKVAQYFSDYGLIALLIIIAYGLAIYIQRNSETFRKLSSGFFLKIPFIGNIVQKLYLARFCQAMNLLLSAQTQLINAIQLVENMVGYYPIERSLRQIKIDVEQGQSLHKSLSAFKIYPKSFVSLINVAEKVNELDSMFGTLAKQYSEEVEHQTSLINSVLEPIIMVFLGLFVGIIVFSIYLPMFQMGMSIH